MKYLAIGSDHAGYELKSMLKDYLTNRGIEVVDVGTHSLASCDYPRFARDLCGMIQNKQVEYGVLVCGTGIGMSMSANRYRGIRAALCANEYHARMSKAHNDSNVLCLGSRVIGSELALSILAAWLETGFEGDRHLRRVNLIDQLPDQNLS